MDALEKNLPEWQKLNAWWEHSGDPRDPHVILSSGEHATVFMNNGVIAQQRPVLFQQMIRDLVSNHPALQFSEDFHAIDFVVAPAMGGIQMAYALGLAIYNETGHSVAQYYSDKIEEVDPITNRTKVVGMLFKRGAPTAGQKGLVFDDVTTSLNALRLCSEAVLALGAEVVGIGTILNRSPFETTTIDGKELPLHSLVRKDIRNHQPDDCPLCKAGSLAFKPKELWNQLIKP